MRLFDALKELFYPQIIREYKNIVAKYREAIIKWNNNSRVINKSSLLNNCLSFKDKKAIVVRKSEIVKIDDEIRQEREKSRKFENIKKEYPLGFKYFEDNYISYGDNKVDKVLSSIEQIKKYQTVCTKYESLKRRYPLGLVAFEEETSWDDGKNYAGLTIEEIIECEDDIKAIENRGKKEEKLKQIERKERERRVRYKDDADEILKVLNENNIKCFYHFTSRRNISSIKKLGGLYSWDFLKSNNIEIPDQGGTPLSEQLDRHYGLQDYVRLSFCESHPMAYRKMQEGTDIVVLKISLDVATLRGTKFSDMNATDNQHSQGCDVESLKMINFAATKRKYVKREDPDFKYLQAEIMVKTFLPIKYILNIDSIQETPSIFNSLKRYP